MIDQNKTLSFTGLFQNIQEKNSLLVIFLAFIPKYNAKHAIFFQLIRFTLYFANV